MSNFAYVPNTGASPNGPVRFDVNTQSLLAVLDRSSNLDAGTDDQHAHGRRRADQPRRSSSSRSRGRSRSSTTPMTGSWSSAASNVVVKIVVDPGHRRAHRAARPDESRPACCRSTTGKNPRGIVVNADGYARVRDELRLARRHGDRPDDARPKACSPRRCRSAALPAPGSIGGHASTSARSSTTRRSASSIRAPVRRRRSPAACRTTAGARARHATAGGLSDNVVWIFAAGPRRTIPQHADFDLTDPLRSTMRPLNWSANRDEEEDFELNIRAVSGGAGPDRAGRRRHAGSERRRLHAACQRRSQPAQGARA